MHVLQAPPDPDVEALVTFTGISESDLRCTPRARARMEHTEPLFASMMIDMEDHLEEMRSHF